MTTCRTTVRRSGRWIFVRRGVFLLLAAMLVQTWLIDGLVVPYRVTGGSMATTLCGVHRSVTCGDCSHGFTCGTDVLPAAPRAVCPNCGYAGNDLQSLPDVNAERVLIDRTTYSFRVPRRWEVVAFRHPTRDDQVVVKRVAGLPGESIEIRHGDVYVDGHIARKNLAEQRALAVLVHDAACSPTRPPMPPPRWRIERPDSRWSVIDGRFICSAGGENEPVDWLAYHHWRRQSNDVQESPVMDLCGYNQSQPRREEDVHTVNDLMLSFRLERISGDGSLFIRVADGCETFEVQLRFDAEGPHNRVVALDSEQNNPFSRRRHGDGVAAFSQTRADVPSAAKRRSSNRKGNDLRRFATVLPPSNGERLIEVSLFDRQFLLAIDGQTIIAYPYDRPELPPPPPSRSLAIGTQGLAATIGGLRVYRDVYYTHPIGPRGHSLGTQPICLAGNEYYVLGDNSPISEDSRTWLNPAANDVKLLLGKPLVAIPSVWLAFGRAWHFQVPNLAQIRYIR